MNEKQRQRCYEVVAFAKKVWAMLPDDSKESYCAGNGTYGFLEDCVTMYQVTLTDAEWDVLFEVFDKDFYQED